MEHFWARLNAFVSLLSLCNLYMTGSLRHEGFPLMIHSTVYSIIAITSLDKKRMGTWQVSCQVIHTIPYHASLQNNIRTYDSLPRHASCVVCICLDLRNVWILLCVGSCLLPADVDALRPSGTHPSVLEHQFAGPERLTVLGQGRALWCRDALVSVFGDARGTGEAHSVTVPPCMGTMLPYHVPALRMHAYARAPCFTCDS